jgi:hypothetical protein
MPSGGPATHAGWFRVTVLAALAAGALTALTYAYVTGSSLLALSGVVALGLALMVILASFAYPSPAPRRGPAPIPAELPVHEPRSAMTIPVEPHGTHAERTSEEPEPEPTMPPSIPEPVAAETEPEPEAAAAVEEPEPVVSAPEPEPALPEPTMPPTVEEPAAAVVPEPTMPPTVPEPVETEPLPEPTTAPEEPMRAPSVRLPLTLEMTAVADALLLAARAAGDAVASHLWLEDPASGTMRLVIHAGRPLSGSHPLPMDADPIGLASAQGAARLAQVPGTEGEADFWRFAVPVRGDGTHGIAAVDFAGDRPDRAALVSVTSQLRGSLTGALALHLSRLEMDTARLLITTARELSRNLDPRGVAMLALDRAMELSDAVSGSVMLLEEGTDEMTIVASRGLPRGIVRETRVREGEGIAGWVLATRQAQLVEDRPGAAAHTRRGVRSAACVPIADEDGILGVLNVGGREYPARLTAAHLDALTVLGAQTATALRNATAMHSARDLYFATLRALALAMETKDPYARGITDRVVRFATALGRALGLDEVEAQALEVAALLHDIGMSATGEVVASCDRPLSTYERGLLKLHPVIAAEILEEVPALDAVVPIVYHHHEWYDGQGYVVGLSGEGIPLGARILSVADAFVAMTSERPYRSAISTEEALAELRDKAGSQFDPEVVDAFAEMLERYPLLLADAS